MILLFNPLTPNVPYSGRTAPLTSERSILYIYSANIVTEYFKHGKYSQFFSSKCSLFHNSNVFGSCIIHILYTGVLNVAFYIFIQQIYLLSILNTVYILRFSLQNAVCFIILTYLVPVLFTFYIQVC